MNLLLAVILMGLCKLGLFAQADGVAKLCLGMASLSLFLCFFNLLPIPPLDGSHIVRILTGMSYQAYYEMARYGFIVLILVWQIPPVQHLIITLTDGTLSHLGGWFGVPVQ